MVAANIYMGPEDAAIGRRGKPVVRDPLLRQRVGPGLGDLSVL